MPNETRRTFRLTRRFVNVGGGKVYRFFRVQSGETFGFYLSGTDLSLVCASVPLVAAAAISRNCDREGRPLLVEPITKADPKKMARPQGQRLRFRILESGEEYSEPTLPGEWWRMPNGKDFFTPRFPGEQVDVALHRRLQASVFTAWRIACEKIYVSRRYNPVDPGAFPEELLA